MKWTMKQWRLVKGYSVDYMAQACRVTRATYASWESAPEKVTIGNAKRISEVLEISVNDIFFN